MENRNNFLYVKYDDSKDEIHLSEESIIIEEFIDKNVQLSLFELGNRQSSN